eukprot:scaffold16470_cov61-Cyclotella_meneghiniana.AAC.6
MKAIPRPRGKAKPDTNNPQETQIRSSSFVSNSQLAAVQSNITSQLNSIISSYQQNPAMLSTLQCKFEQSNIVYFGYPLTETSQY